MSESLIIIKGEKEQQYQSLLPQIESLISLEQDLIANMSNITAALKAQFNWWWVGFYIVKGESLVVGPFQGPIACTRIAKGKGVCGKSWQHTVSIIVPDVSQFEGHIACSSLSQSEIVVPIIKEGKVVAVLDVDSEALNTFDEIDKLYLEKLVHLIQF